MIAALLTVAGLLGEAGEPLPPIDEVRPGAYRVVTLPIPEGPEGIVLEVGGIALLPDGRPIVCTRRGEVWIVENAYGDPDEVRFRRFADGLHEPLGLLVHEDGWIYAVQRGELSRMRDVDGDDVMDELETVCDAWDLSGSYHEYAFGPRLDHEGHFWLTLNIPFGDEPLGSVDWRGFALRVAPDGTMQPMACGLRSPCGVETSPWGDVFYTDNQGEWCGAGKLAHLEPGDFHGHPLGIFSCERPEWRFEQPDQPPDGKKMFEVAEELPTFKLPAVWFPYDEMGRSQSGFVWDRTEGRFGPFAGQVFVGDQYAASIARVDLEQVDGHWQGACFPFLDGLESGVTRLAWGEDGSLFVGMTDRGWPALGRATYGLQRVVWTGDTPFALRTMRALPEGFRLRFTEPVDPATASDPSAYSMTSYTYLLHEPYGSPEVDEAEPAIVSVSLSEDGLTADLAVEGLRAGYVHELRTEGLRSAGGAPLVDGRAYYTLIRRPTGE